MDQLHDRIRATSAEDICAAFQRGRDRRARRAPADPGRAARRGPRRACLGRPEAAAGELGLTGRHLGLPGPAHPGAGGLREHPGRRPARARLGGQHPAHQERQGRRIGRPRHPRADVRLLQRVRGRSRTAHPDRHGRGRLRRPQRDPVPPAPADALTQTRQAEQARRSRLEYLFHDADTQAGIRGTAWAGYQAIARVRRPLRPGARHPPHRDHASHPAADQRGASRLKRAAWAALAPTR